MAHIINNEIYNELGDRWYSAFDNPVALLRAESKLIGPWIIETVKNKMLRRPIDAIDLGCGGGFISNQLAKAGLKTIAFDLSENSLAIAAKYDVTNSVNYRIGDITNVPLEGGCCDVVTCCDVIEHVSSPQKIITEAYRLLRPGGMFFFHTFNRNIISHLIAIKFVEWFVKNTPSHLHVFSLFVKPKEIEKWTKDAGFIHFNTIGTRPSIRSLLNGNILRRTVPETVKFKFTKSRCISYVGFAIKCY
jgi:2-polyprenyl-6-hydroxyphenyl methylase / 3-demethylubiquinone-9 3-methyltransferase